MPLDKPPHDRYSDDRDRAHKTAWTQLVFALKYVEHLRKVDPQKRAETAARSMLTLLKNGEELSPGQLSYADGIYEQVMKAMGLPSVNVHSDKRRRSLRYG